jgi:O-antigen/teichoic acid export membrane protein
MGSYALASDVAGMPSSELLQPLNRVLFPAFAQVKHDLAELKRLFVLAQAVQVLVAVPAGTAVALMAGEIVPLLFGEKWLTAIPFLQALAFGAVVEAVMSSAGFVNIALGRVKHVSAVVWSQVGMFILLAWWLVPAGGALEIAMLRVASLTIGLVLQITFVLQALRGLSPAEMAASIWRPLLASAALVVATLALKGSVDVSTISLLVLEVLLWSLGYPAALLLLWALCGRPEGAEAYLIGKLRFLWLRTRRQAAARG